MVEMKMGVSLFVILVLLSAELSLTEALVAKQKRLVRTYYGAQNQDSAESDPKKSPENKLRFRGLESDSNGA